MAVSEQGALPHRVRRRFSHPWFLVRELVKRDFQSRYAGSVLGAIWSLVQPLFTLALFTFVFGVLLDLKLKELGVNRTESFALFLFGGLLPWMAFQEGVSRATTAVTDNADLVKKLRFPPQLLLVSIVLGALLHAGMAAIIYLGVLLFEGELSVTSLPILLVALPIQVALTLGLGLVFGALHVFFRDTGQFVTLILNAWFYFTPIVYAWEHVPERLWGLLALNPLTGIVELYRAAFLGGPLDTLRGVPVSAGTALVVLLLGLWLFSRVSPCFADEI